MFMVARMNRGPAHPLSFVINGTHVLGGEPLSVEYLTGLYVD